MNIFVLDKDPVKAAQMHCDKHCVKMILETAQMLCSAYEYPPYKRTHVNHPCSIWARKSKENYLWLIDLGIALHDEYRFRYGMEKRHKSFEIIMWCHDNMHRLSFPESGLTPFAQAMPQEYKCIDPVRAYRNYYLADKKDLLVYTTRSSPKWIQKAKLK